MSHQRMVWLIVLLTAGAGLCLFLCCGGVVHIGLGITTEEVRHALEADPRFVDHVGQVQEFSMDYVGSLSGGDDVWVYNVKATKWSGRITVKHVTGDDGNERIVWARFTLASGEIVELKPEEGATN